MWSRLITLAQVFDIFKPQCQVSHREVLKKRECCKSRTLGGIGLSFMVGRIDMRIKNATLARVHSQAKR